MDIPMKRNQMLGSFMAAFAAVVVASPLTPLLAQKSATDVYTDHVRGLGFAVLSPPRTGLELGAAYLVEQRRIEQIIDGKRKRKKVARMHHLCTMFPGVIATQPETLVPTQVESMSRLKDFEFLGRAVAMTGTPIQIGGGFSSTNLVDYSIDWGVINYAEISLLANKFASDPKGCRDQECRVSANYNQDHRDAQICAQKIDDMHRKYRKHVYIVTTVAYADALDIDFSLNPHITAQAVLEASTSTNEATSENEENTDQTAGEEVTEDGPNPALLGSLTIAPTAQIIGASLESQRKRLSNTENTILSKISNNIGELATAATTRAADESATANPSDTNTEGDGVLIDAAPLTKYAASKCGTGGHFGLNLIKIFGIGGGGRICQVGETSLRFATPNYVGYSAFKISDLRDLGAIYFDAAAVEISGRQLTGEELEKYEGAEGDEELDAYLAAIGATLVNEQTTEIE